MNNNELLNEYLTESEISFLKSRSLTKFAQLSGEIEEIDKLRKSKNSDKPSFEIVQLGNSIDLDNNHFIMEYRALFLKFLKLYDLKVEGIHLNQKFLSSSQLLQMMKVAENLPEYARKKLKDIESTDIESFNKIRQTEHLQLMVDDDEDNEELFVRISDTLFDCLTMSETANFSSCTAWKYSGAGRNTPLLYFNSPYCKIAKFYEKRADAEANQNHIGRVVVSFMPSGNIIFHRVYAKDKPFITKACHSLAKTFGESLTAKAIKISCKRRKGSYPDLLLSLSACLNHHVIVDESQLNNDIKVLGKAYDSCSINVF